MAAIDQNGVLNFRRTSEGRDSIHRGPAASTGIKNVVHKNENGAIQIDRQIRRHDGSGTAPEGEIVTVHGDIHHAKSRANALNFLDVIDDPTGDFDPAGGNSRHDETGKVRVSLHDL